MTTPVMPVEFVSRDGDTQQRVGNQVEVVGASTGNAVPVANQGAAVVLTPVLTVGGAYQVGDALGALMTLTDIASGDGKAVYIVSSIMADKGEQTFTASLIFFNQNPNGSTFTDNSALNISDGDAGKVAGWIPFTSFKDLGAAKFSQGDVTMLEVVPVAGSKTLYAAVIVDSGTPTFAAGDIVITLKVIKD